jgi:predicted membrane-bound mannosyltransferase
VWRDERTQAIADKAARNSFIVLMLAVAPIAVYFGSIARTDVPIALVCLLPLLGMAVHFAADIWLRRI